MSKSTKKVTLHLQAELFEQVKKKLEADGSSLEDYLRLQVITLALAKYTVGLDDEMPFGKYKGIQVYEVVQENPQYIAWLARVSDIIRFSSKVLEALEQETTKRLADRPKKKADVKLSAGTHPHGEIPF